MKLKLLLAVAASFLIMGSVSAAGYTVVKGDTLSSIASRFGTTWQNLFNANRDVISNPNLIYPGQVIDTGNGGMLGAAPMRPSGIDIKIRQALVSGASRTGTTLNVDSIVTADGHRWAMTDIGDIAFGKIDPGTSNEEIISWSNMTDNGTYYTLTGVVWGYDYTGLTTSTANYKRHNSGARFIITDDDHYLRYQYLNKYDGLMQTGYAPTSTYQVATVGYVQTFNGYYEAPVANFAALPTGINQGEMRVTLDDGKVYTWSGSTWILAGAGGGSGTVYRDDITVTSSAQLIYSLSSGSWPDKKYLQVFLNGQLLSEGASADYQASTTGNSITLNFAPVVGEVITLRVESIDFYNAEWANVNTNLTPDLDATHNIGSSTKRFKDLFLAGNASVGGTLSVTGTTTLATTTLGSTVIDNITINNTTTTFNNVIVNGTLISSSTNLISGTELISSADTERNTDQAAYTKLKEIRMNVDATSLNIYFERQMNAGGGSTQCARVYKNGVALGAEFCTNINNGGWETQNAAYTGFIKGDLLQLYAKTSNPSYATAVKNFRIYADTYSTVITN